MHVFLEEKEDEVKEIYYEQLNMNINNQQSMIQKQLHKIITNENEERFVEVHIGEGNGGEI